MKKKNDKEKEDRRLHHLAYNPNGMPHPRKNQKHNLPSTSKSVAFSFH